MCADSQKQLKDVLSRADFATFLKLLSAMRRTAEASHGGDNAQLAASAERIRAHLVAVGHEEQWPGFAVFLPPSLREQFAEDGKKANTTNV